MRACNNRCQYSVLPVSACRCPCQGRRHGSKRWHAGQLALPLVGAVLVAVLTMLAVV